MLTDGNMTAGTRCVHPVEEVSQTAISSPEPPGMKLDESASRVLGSAIENPAVPYQSSLLNRSGLPSLGPAPPLTSYEPVGRGTRVPIYPPPPPIGVCGPVKK